MPWTLKEPSIHPPSTHVNLTLALWLSHPTPYFRIGALFCFSALKDYLYEETNEELQPIIRKMFEELTVLGFIGLVVFVIVKFKVMRMIEHSVFSSSKDKDDEGTVRLTAGWASSVPNNIHNSSATPPSLTLRLPQALTELTENIHMVVFLVAVIFLVQVFPFLPPLLGCLSAPPWKLTRNCCAGSTSRLHWLAHKDAVARL